MEQDVVQPDKDAFQQVFRDDARQGRLQVTDRVGRAVQDPRGRLDAARSDVGLAFLRQQGEEQLPVSVRHVEVREVDRPRQARKALL